MDPFNSYKLGVFMIVQFIVFSGIILGAMLGILAFEVAEKSAFKKTKDTGNCAPTSTEKS
jgi:hypothetical protein